MGFDLGDIWNPVEQFQDAVNGASSTFGGQSGAADTYKRTPGGLVPSTQGQLLAQQTGLPAPVGVNDGTRQALLAQQGGIAGQFADQNQKSYNAYGQQGQQALGGLQAIANGQNSVSGMQLQQAMQQNLAQQRSLAAGASPQNSAMAARTAAIQGGHINSGLAGQQAVAGLQERNQAWNQYGQLLGTMRGQDLNAALSSRQNAMSGYGAGMTGAPQPSWIQQYGPAIAAGAAAVASDRRLKTDISDGDAAANRATKKLSPFAFAYKDSKYGAGKQLGVMAQDLESAGLGHAVMDTPQGKMVHGAKLATSNTAMIAALGRRLAKVEAEKAGKK
jgi:hypothetical protein